jgi:hypothetical protein
MDETGIYWIADRDQWLAQFFFQGRVIHVGWFDDLHAAIQARNRIKKIYGNPKTIPPRPSQT